MSGEYILDFNEEKINLHLAGGKGVNLARLARLNFNVPPGFIITTRFYEKFVKDNDLDEFINKSLNESPTGDYEVIEALSKKIRDRFLQGKLSSDLLDLVYTAYEKMNSPSVAVRSSATAEDLADLSFAGQHDTFLNIIGIKALRDAILACLSSLWTTRAIFYRNQNSIDHEGLAIAVIVQKMVDSETSGVLFTANPLTGKRSEYVIDATFGLGEALVSGQIEPDHYVVESTSGKIIHTKLGSKALSIRAREKGGVVKIEEQASDRATLAPDEILALIQLGQLVTEHYGSPQDIEWAIANDELFLLQSRPVTSLYPLPGEFLSGPPRACFSLATVQGMLGPITPLGRDNISLFLFGIVKGFGYKPSIDDQQNIWNAGGRLFIDVSFMLRNRGMNKIVLKAASLLDRETQLIFEQLVKDQWISPKRLPHFKALRRMTRAGLFMIKDIRDYAKEPRKKRLEKQAVVEEVIKVIEHQSGNLKTLQEKIAYYKIIMNMLTTLCFIQIAPAVPLGYGPLLMINHLARGLTGDETLAFELTRSLPNNPTTEMNLILGETAKVIKADKTSRNLFAEQSAEMIVNDYLSNQLPRVAQEALGAFLNTYGMRGLGEIDFGLPRWREDPVPIIKALQNYLKLPSDQTPEIQFQEGMKAANRAYMKLYASVIRTRGGRLKARGLNAGIRRLRELAGLREYPKFSIVRIFGITRKFLLDSGRELAKKNILDNEDDIFFLHLDELEKLATGKKNDWKSLVRSRRGVYEREKQRKSIPRVILSDGRTFYEGIARKVDESENSFTGSPVSPGVVEGVARIVLDPHESKLEPGEILICPATDPSWTPLFLVAKGLVMELGGMMVHGSVVAREHNIPAVVSVVNATSRIETGQLVRVNGSTGQVQILRSN